LKPDFIMKVAGCRTTLYH